MAKAELIQNLTPRMPVRESLPEMFAVRISELWSWAEHMPFPDRVRELHDMRIAAKRLRYLFEFLQPCFNDDFKKNLKRFKKLQDYLGEIHDCDVWVDYLRSQVKDAFRELNAQRKSLNQFVGADPDLKTAAGEFSSSLAQGPIHGLLMMLEDVVDRREVLYKELLEYWTELEASDFRGELSRLVAAAARTPENSA